ncbi:MAG: DUF255 domain-containing protein [Bacteroidia bacterium]|nr:DUF255 domain-containing protein [Bacteroidia bacterium]
MKRGIIATVFLISLTLLSFTTSKQEVAWEHWNEGFQKAKAENKIALIDTYTAWCGWCKKMDRDTYEDQAIIDKIGKNFVPIKFNPELGDKYQIGDTTVDGRTLLGALSKGKSSGYPTTFFYLPKQNQMLQYPGYMDAQKFGNLLDRIAEMHEGASSAN